MNKILPVFLALAASCAAPLEPTIEIPIIEVQKVYLSDKEKQDYDSVVEKIVSECKHLATKKRAKSKTILHFNQDSEEYEKREVYKLQEPVVKISMYKSDVIISLRDIYQDGNVDLEIRVISEEGKMKIYRDLFPFDSLNEVDECSIEWDRGLVYYSCKRKTIDEVEKRLFSNIIKRVENKLNGEVPLLKTGYHYTESKYILERSEGIVHLTGFESPYK